MGDVQRRRDVFRDVGGDDRFADLLEGLLEEFAVLRLVDGFHVGADEPDTVLGQEILLLELHGDGEPGLAAEAGEQAVGLFLFDDPLDGLGRQGFEVDLIGEGLVRHDGRRVRVDEDDVDTRFLQDAAGLGTGVVELRRLTDDDGAGADDEDLFDVFIQRHSARLPSCTSPPSCCR